MDEYVKEINDLLDEEIPDRKGVISITSPTWRGSVNSAFVIGVLKNPKERTKTQSEIVRQLVPLISQNTKARAFVSEPETIGGRGISPLPVQYVIQAPEMDDLKRVLPDFFQKAVQRPEFSFVNVNLKFNKPEIKIEIDRERANALGVSVRDVAQNLQLAISGQRFGYFIMGGKQYQVIGQVDRVNRNDPNDIKSLYVRNNEGIMIQLDNLVNIEEQSNPPQLYRYNRYSSATFSANLSPGNTVSDGIAVMDEISKEVLDDSFTTTLAGSSREFKDSSNSLYFAFLFALVLIYLVLSAQFESFRDPLIIMFTVPLAIAGALFTLFYYNQTLNIFSQIGIIMLIGLVTKKWDIDCRICQPTKSPRLKCDGSDHWRRGSPVQANINDQFVYYFGDTSNSIGPWRRIRKQNFNGHRSNRWVNIINNIDTLCNTGDVLLFHRQVKKNGQVLI